MGISIQIKNWKQKTLGDNQEKPVVNKVMVNLQNESIGYFLEVVLASWYFSKELPKTRGLKNITHLFCHGSGG